MGSTARFIIQAQHKRKRFRLGCKLQLVLAVVVIGLLLHFLIIPFFITGGGNADSQPVPGDAKQFDPITALPEVVAYAGAGAQLISMDAYYVRADGTLDLTADYYARVTYKFVREIPRPGDAPPIGAGGSNLGPWYEPVTIEAYRPGQWRKVTSGSLSYTYMNQGMEREVDDAISGLQPVVPVPVCALTDLWQVALTKDSPPDAVAIIRYDREGNQFSISGLSVNLNFDQDCAANINLGDKPVSPVQGSGQSDAG